MLLTLEAVVRCRGISAAAKELGVTHGAISKQIGLLEDWLGRKLFDREHRRFRPYDETVELATLIGDRIDGIERAVSLLQSARNHLKVVAHASFAMYWLVPRLPQFYALNADVDIHLQTRQTAEDPWTSSFDVALMRGADSMKDWDACFLLQENITLLTTSERAAALSAAGLSATTKEPFVVADTRPGEIERWLEAAGLPPLQQRAERRFGHFHTAIAAVLNGHGVLAGPIEFSNSRTANQPLTAPFPEIIVPGQRHTAYINPAAASYSIATRFVDWLRETLISPY